MRFTSSIGTLSNENADGDGTPKDQGKAKRFTAYDWRETGCRSAFGTDLSGTHFALSET